MTTPSVLAVVVVRDAAPWLRRSLASLARQTHPRVGVLAVDNASTDGSAEILERLLGKRRVIRSERNLGFPGAVRRALAVPAAREADYVLLLHDDVALAPNAVEAMVEAAGRFDRAGIVGAKIVDWERPEVLREVGFASDRFAHPYSPLEEDEIDHGQYDAPREVLFVSSAAMLVAREVWSRIGDPDERLRPSEGDVDLCWRARLSGFRVVVTPDAVVYHRMAGAREERRDDRGADERYVVERAALAAMLKNYRAVTLLWILPVYVVYSTLRAVGAAVSRRLDEVVGILRAWGWNLLRFPGTIRRRARAQAVRTTSDREIARFMTPPGTRLRRLVQQASALVGRRGASTLEEEEPEPEPLRRRAATMLSAHPAAIALGVAAFLVLVGFRDVLFVPEIRGGALPAFPDHVSSFFGELTSPWRSTGFGGSGGASPAVGVLGLAGTVTLGNPQLLARLVVALGPLLAAASCFRAVSRVTADRRAATVAAAVYGLSGLTLWAASEGRIAAIVLLAGLPWIAMRVGLLFDAAEPVAPARWILGTAAVLALVGSFFPAVWLAVALVALPVAVTARGVRGRALALSVAATGAAAVLMFPFARELALAGGGTDVEAAGRADFFLLLRLAPDATLGGWLPAFFLPVAAALGFALAHEDGGWSGRAIATAALGVPLAWLAAAGWLPGIVSNPVAYLAAAAFALSLAVGLGAASALSTVRRTAFGSAQIATAGFAAAIVVGLLAQSSAVLLGRWEVRESGEPPAWPVVSRAAARTEFRVLWLGDPQAGALPAPGGEPTGTVPAGAATVAYAVTGRDGRSALSLGLPAESRGDDAVREAISAMLSGDVRHAGALLAPMGIRFVVSAEGALPPAAAARVDEQVDIDLLQSAGGLSIWRNARALPVASAVTGSGALDAARSPSVLAGTQLDASAVRRLDPEPAVGWSGAVGDADLVLAATDFDPRWKLHVDGSEVSPFPAFGWATGFESSGSAGTASVAFDAGSQRAIELGALALLWTGVLWVLGRPPRTRARHVRTQAVAAPPERRTSPPAASGAPRGTGP